MAVDIEHCNFRYLAPKDLEVTPTPIKKVLVIGSCMGATMAEVVGHMESDASADFIQFNFFGDMPEAPPAPIENYDFQIVQVLSRFIFDERLYFSLTYDDVAGYKNLFEKGLAWMTTFLDDALKWNILHGILTFIPTFLVPQQNQLGRLLPRYDLRNPVYFFEQLNFHLHEEARRFKNVHIIEFEQILCSFGKRFSRDDGVWALSHGAFLGDGDEDHDKHRIEKPMPIREYYQQCGYEALQAHWIE